MAEEKKNQTIDIGVFEDVADGSLEGVRGGCGCDTYHLPSPTIPVG